jgi:hypothetical protein
MDRAVKAYHPGRRRPKPETKRQRAARERRMVEECEALLALLSAAACRSPLYGAPFDAACQREFDERQQHRSAPPRAPVITEAAINGSDAIYAVGVTACRQNRAKLRPVKWLRNLSGMMQRRAKSDDCSLLDACNAFLEDWA